MNQMRLRDAPEKREEKEDGKTKMRTLKREDVEEKEVERPGRIWIKVRKNPGSKEERRENGNTRVREGKTEKEEGMEEKEKSGNTEVRETTRTRNGNTRTRDGTEIGREITPTLLLLRNNGLYSRENSRESMKLFSKKI